MKAGLGSSLRVREVKRHDVFGVEAQVAGFEIMEGFNKQSGTDQQR